ncbi:MAG: ferrous iron transport protein B [Deltaproteobacteria bacterium]|nr:ferrous iron transport protein B [Deltaproteobacteria bacterium]
MADDDDKPGDRRPMIVLAGNPNVGKTTLFNALTGLSAKVSNYPGITVERRVGRVTLPDGRVADLCDLPGTYSLNARSAEEQIAFDAIVGLAGEPVPDAAIVCLDATQLARSAYLLLQIQELGTRCVVALTMVDEAKSATPDPKALGALLGCEVVAVTARTRTGIPELLDAVVRAAHGERRAVWTWEPDPAIAAGIAAVRAALPDAWMTRTRFGTSVARGDDALALWALSSIEARADSARGDADELDVPAAVRTAVERADLHEGKLDAPILARWAFLDRELPRLVAKPPDRTRTERIDRVLLHRIFGFAVFLGVMAVVFMSLFAWSKPAIDGVDSLFKWLGDELRTAIAPAASEDLCDKLTASTDARTIVTDFLVDGVIGGVGAVMVFLPQILLLFLFLGFLEDCGYLARVAYLMDRIMRTMNLHGRAFVPMLSGFACAVPAIMATRTMERRRDRILTMMVVPLMTCSARLPVYTLVIAALIPGSAATQALLMVGMYLFSVSTALAAAWIMSRTVQPLKAKRLPFLIELPPYRLPRLRDVLRMMWSKSSMFLREAGTVILVCSIALWALLSFPRDPTDGHPDRVAACAVADGDEAKQALVDAESGARLAESYGGRLGHTVEPVLAPLGFDWKIDIGIIGAFAAREVFVSTLGIVYSVGGEADESSEPLREALRSAKKPDGSQAYTPLVGLSLMIFFALACQCMSTLAVVRRETRSWRWPAFLFGYMTTLAWIASMLVYQVGRLLGFG